MKRRTQIGFALAVCALILLAWYLWPRAFQKPASSMSRQSIVTNKIRTVTRIENAPAAFPPSSPAPEGVRPQEEIFGIGAVLSRPNTEDGVVQITRVLPNSPAEAAGLFGPLNIYKVDGVSLSGRSLQDSVAMLRGPAGTRVRLEVGKPLQEETFEVEVTRQRVIVPGGERPYRRIPEPPGER